MTTRVVFTLPRDTALPGDETVNTFYVGITNATPKASAAEADAITLAIQRFYDVVVPPNANSIAFYFGQVSDGANAKLRFYDLADPEPRVPYHERACPITIGGGTSIPEECAVVLSYQRAELSGLPQARRRGRLYLGPLNANAAQLTNGRVRVVSAFRDAMQAAAGRLEDELLAISGGTFAWAQYSPTNNDAGLVTNGWVDDAFDTQRRRGPDPTVRETWS